MALHTMSCDIFIEKWLIWLPGRGAVWETDHSNSQAVKSPIIWWMVYLPNRWGETCIEIKRAGFFGTCPGHGNRLEIWIIRLCSPSGSKLEMNSSCEWFSAANNAARRVYHPWLSCSRGGKKKMGLSIARLHTCVDSYTSRRCSSKILNKSVATCD